ncbi:MAG: 4Fe-4S binding protein [Oscillospiraceae bacterium]|nr:4Fe-4S binding protein [Oscillospiraceae bacterium]
MKYIVIDGIKCEYDTERSVLEVALHNGIEIPNLCYCESLSAYGGCRLCVFENERGGVAAACTTPPRDGLTVRTNTPKIREYRRGILELMLESHNTDCAACSKSGKCRLQEYSKRYGVGSVRSAGYCREPVDDSSHSIVYDPSKCILCGKCVRMCDELQNVRAIDFMERGNDTYISCGEGYRLADSSCTGCGQCAAVCPTGALMLKSSIERLRDAIADPGKKLAVQIAPAVRIGLAEEFGLAPGRSVMGKAATALKLLGADYVYDTSMRAYQTVICEAEDFAAKRGTGTVFSSYCPAWVRHVECDYPQLLPQLSTAGSPMEVCAALIRLKHAGSGVISAAVMPCSAAKSEAERPELIKNGDRLVDIVLSTQELAEIIRENGMNFAALPETPCDGLYSQITAESECLSPILLSIDESRCIGCTRCAKACPVGAISGAAKKAHSIDAGKCIRCRICTSVCPKEAIGSTANPAVAKRVAAVNGLAEADALAERIKSGEAWYDYVEVMACPLGCPGGGGQPEACCLKRQNKTVALLELEEEYTAPAGEPVSAESVITDGDKSLFRVNYI